MHNNTLQPITIQALQYFLTIWRQDPAAQNNLEICSSNIFLWNPNNLNNTSDITSLVNTAVDTPTNPDDIETLLDNILTEEPEINSTAIDLPHDTEPGENPIPDNATPNIEPETETYQRVQNELIQSLTPQSHNHPNPFLGGIWKDQLTKILHQLEDKGRT